MMSYFSFGSNSIEGYSNNLYNQVEKSVLAYSTANIKSWQLRKAIEKLYFCISW